MFHDPEIFRAVLDSLPIGVYVVDRDLKIVFWNRGAEKISGYLAQDVLGRYCREKLLVDLDESNPVACGEACQLTDSMHEGRPREAEVILRHRSGHRIPVYVRAVPLRDSDNKITGAAETFEETRRMSWQDRFRKDPEFEGKMDRVTGLPDTETMNEMLQQSCAEAVEEQLPLCVLLVEVDGLKKFQSEHGKEAAETELQVVGHTLSNALRPTDVVGCWGEHRFMAIVKNCEEQVLQRVGERVRKMESFSEVEWWGDKLTFTVSIGGAGLRPGDPVEPLLERAEQALGRSVDAGGNRATVISADEFMNTKG
jgi:diguanylate cyclase (GGDEF)-like protein/PAS domain S-box-containing protein